MEDAEIVELYWQRSDHAIAETAQKYGPYCHRITYNICENLQDAEECVNDTWLAAWNAMPDERPTLLGRFLACLARNAAIGRWRERHRLKRGGGETALALDELAECLADGKDLDAELERRELERLIGDFVAGLRETEQTVFTARYFYLTPVAEIARRLGFSESKVKSMLLRLRGRLRQRLEKEGYAL